MLPLGWRAASVVVRTPLDAHATAESLRAIVADLDRTVPVTVETMEQQTGSLAQRPRFNAIRLLAAIGLYGVMAFPVAQRTREIGVRMAPANAARWTAAGAVLGIAGSFFAERALDSMLFGVAPTIRRRWHVRLRLWELWLRLRRGRRRGRRRIR